MTERVNRDDYTVKHQYANHLDRVITTYISARYHVFTLFYLHLVCGTTFKITN